MERVIALVGGGRPWRKSIKKVKGRVKRAPQRLGSLMGRRMNKTPRRAISGKIRRLKGTRTLEARADFGIKYEFSIDKEQCHGYIIDV
jgi:hypothetical protein